MRVGGAERISLDQAGNYPSAFFGGNLVHEFKVALMLERSSIITIYFPGH